MLLNHIIKHGLFFTVIVNGYLFILMITMSPRVWGYRDYPEVVKQKVPPQTKKEKALAGIVGLPWFIFVLGFPVVSTYMLKSNLGDEISFFKAFLNIYVLFSFATVGDLVILDWLIISKITPRFVIIPGTEVRDYKDFSHHYKGHAKAAILLIPLSLIIAAIVLYI